MHMHDARSGHRSLADIIITAGILMSRLSSMPRVTAMANKPSSPRFIHLCTSVYWMTLDWQADHGSACSVEYYLVIAARGDGVAFDAAPLGLVGLNPYFLRIVSAFGLRTTPEILPTLLTASFISLQ